MKYKLMLTYRNERHKYVEAKSPMIWEIIQRANDWSQRVGWDLESSDA
jgi:hypothetical protein